MTGRMASGVPQADGSLAAGAAPWTRSTSPTRCVYMASLPLDANVQFLTVMATKMPFVGRG